MSDLLQKQWDFADMVAKLIVKAGLMGYRVSLGETYRTPEQAAINAKKGIGVKNSLHTQRLAIDINLFKEGVYLTATEDYKPLGVWWESLGGSWGGRFSKPDGNHFSLSFGGVK